MTTRYRIRAWRSWSDADPAYIGEADSLDGARYVCAYLTEPLIDVIEAELRADGRPSGGGRVVAVRRLVQHPAMIGTPFEPRDDLPTPAARSIPGSRASTEDATDR